MARSPARWSLGLPGGTCVKCWWGGPRPPSLRGKERERDSAGDGPGTTNAPARGSWQIQVSGGLQLDSLRSRWRSFLLQQGLGPALVSKSEPGPRRPEGRAVTHGPTARPAGGVGRRAGQGGPRGRLGRRSSLPAGTLAENGLCGRREGGVPCSPPAPRFGRALRAPGACPQAPVRGGPGVTGFPLIPTHHRHSGIPEGPRKQRGESASWAHGVEASSLSLDTLAPGHPKKDHTGGKQEK